MISTSKVKTYIDQNFSQFGVTRKQELSRLIYEIAKREQCQVDDVLKDYQGQSLEFDHLKKYLMRRRFPQLTKEKDNKRFALTKLDINPDYRVELNKKTIDFKNVYIEEAIKDTLLAQNISQRCPDAKIQYIESYKKHVGKIKFGIKDYNERMNSLFLMKENYDFFKQCPCSNKSVFCGYHVINLGSGCAFECRYCYLQDYINSPGIIIPANIEDFFDQFLKYKQDIRIGSGELTDSLVFDHITEFSPRIVEFFRKFPKSQFEFKTKSDNVNLLLNARSAGNIIISWSMNPQVIIDSVEHLTASLDKRIEAAKKCAQAGYKVAFHFDPIIYFKDWEEEYKGLIDQIFQSVPKESIKWMSLGALRMTPRLKHIIENRFPDSSMLDEEFYVSYDEKLRYDQNLRLEMYSKIKAWIKDYAPQLAMYLCMEDKSTCSESQSSPLKQFRSNESL